MNFYKYQFEQCQNHSRNTWGLINEITCRKKRSKNTIHVLKLANGSSTSDPKTIVNKLNNYFTKIGTKMSSNLPTAQTPYNQFLKNRQQGTFCLLPTDPMEILEMIESFAKNTPGQDKIPAKFFKLGAPALANILSVLINQCFVLGKFPQSLKIARVTPIHKGGPKDINSNYRPISIISVISKLIE